MKDDIKEVVGDKKPKSFEKNARSVEVRNGHDKNFQNGIGVLLKKETDIDTLDYEELVSKALKLPLLSNSYCNVVDTAKATAREVDEPVPPQVIGPIEKPNGKAGSAGKVWEDKKANAHDDFSVYPRKDNSFKGEKGDDIAKADSNVSKGRKALNELIDPPKQKAGQKAMSLEEDGMKLAPGKEHSSSGAKKKSKGSQSHGVQVAEVPNDSLTSDSSFVPKNKKSTHGSNYLSKSEVGDFKLQTDYGKARDRYKDFFGDIELEQEDNDVDSVEMSIDDRLKDSDVVGKSTLTFNSTPKERFYGPGTMAPLVKEDWVCCDKCQKWRLLPLGTNPDSLPEKWLCSMLNWLPGMNRCSISEEETTKALIAHYQVSAPESQNNLHVHPGGVVSGVTSSDARLFYQNHENVGSHAIPSGGKKKQGLKRSIKCD
ncbi:hypothetical protein F0562_033868 [Nyssa sinensis]|uniref:CW-type domain-containing protein n=1 Tax=Nyssa sinensis TaxID=561372 RepID=A0A5J5AEC0_9ASTE|nr:hypothetical protein F0562_033868 [Nyssa sinensis]